MAVQPRKQFPFNQRGLFRGFPVGFRRAFQAAFAALALVLFGRRLVFCAALMARVRRLGRFGPRRLAIKTLPAEALETGRVD